MALLRHRRTRLAVIAMLAICAVVAFEVGENVSVERDVELAVTADQGSASVSLAADVNGISPGCGCVDPVFGKLNWTGLAVPSEGFDLSLQAKHSSTIRDGEWQMTAMAPEPDVIDWFASPYQTLMMTVIVRRNGRSVQVFHGRTTFLDVVGGKPIRIDQARRFPYLALLPGNGGSTSIASESPSRPGAGGSVELASEVPDRDRIALPIRRPEPAATQWGPMIDLIGRTEFRLERARDEQVYAGKQLIRGIRPTDQVSISIETPFSLRLFSSPAPRRWANDMPTIFEQEKNDANRMPFGALQQFALGPTLTGRFVVSEPLPSYSVRLANLAVPDQRAWSRFAGRSARKQVVGPLLGPDLRYDREFLRDYGLPPVSRKPEIGVFGEVTGFQSSALRGNLLIGSDSSPISRGQDVSLSSSGGVDAGKYRFTSLISAGGPTEETSIAGQADVSVAGEVKTGLGWLRWLAAATGAAVIALVVGGLVAWGWNGGK